MKIRATDVLARRLYDAGCRYAFGMPGGEVLTLVDALEKAGIRFVLVKHENSGGFMAEGTWHRTGAPGILVATLGPGAMNGVNSVANALQDRVPLIVLTGCVDADEALTYTHQVMDHQQVFAPLTKASFRLTALGSHVVADKAVSIACEGRPGPVHIDIPISVADELVSLAGVQNRVAASLCAPAVSADLDLAKSWLGAAKRPVMIVGLDAVNQGCGEELTRFVDTFGIPFVTTYKAKGLIREDHPLCLGAAGLSPPADNILVPFIQSADLIICAGYDPIEMRPGWRNIWDSASVNVIDIAAEANHHYMHQATLNFVSDVGPTLAVLGKDVQENPVWPQGEVEKVRAALGSAFPTDEDWGPAAVMDECHKALPDTALATADSGAHRILLSQVWSCSEPRGLMQSSALCTMGCALPLAFGAGLADPQRPVITFMGDAGFLMVAGELATAAELSLKTIIVVFVDSSLALIEMKQRQRQMKSQAVDFATHDYAAIARAFGGNGADVASRSELKDALAQAQDAECFTLIAAKIDRRAYDGRI